MIELPGGALVDIPETVLEVGAVTIHEHKAPARTIERWKNKDGFRALQRSYLPEIREAENALWMAWVSRFVNYAQGAQLDMIGRIVGEIRQGRVDANYRLRILARILINKSFGTAADIQAMLAVIEPTEARVVDLPPASLRVDFAGVLQGFSSLAELAALISETRAAGVGAGVVLPTSDTIGLRWAHVANPFRSLDVRAFDHDSVLDGDTIAIPMTDGVDGPREGARLFLQVAIEDGTDIATPSGWTLLSNLQQNTFRQKLWTKITDDSGEPATLDFVGGATGRTIGRIYDIAAPDLTVGTLVTATGTGASVSAPALTAPCWGLAFIAYDSGGTIGAFKDGGGDPWWVEAVPEAVAGTAAAGVGLSLQTVNATASNPSGSRTADLSNSEDWIRVGFALGTRVLNGWNSGKLAHRKSA